MASIAVLAAAGTGAQAQVQVDASGFRGRLRLLTGSASLAAGALAVVTLDSSPTADLDAFLQSVGQVNGGVFSSVEILLTPWNAPPLGCTFLVVAQLNASGQMPTWALGCTAPLNPSTGYRFGWRIFA